MKSIRNALNAAAETLSVKTPSSSSSSSSPHDLRGKVVSVGAMRIKCGDAIADGGMATVYRGRVLDDPGNNIRDVAVKQMLLPHDSSVSELDARREVELHARLSHHECVVAQLAHDVRLVPLPGGDGDCYRVLAVLELCSESLADALATAASRGEYMEETEALRAFHAAASAIARMHAETPSPLLHRDVKPENVLRARDGDGGGWKLCDFGSARVGCVPLATANDRARAEAEMVRVTTPPYRSPELWDAFRFAEIGPPSDVWALGCVLYQALFNALPFGAESRMAALNGTFTIPKHRSSGAGGAAGGGNGRSDAAVELTRATLVVDPTRRVTAAAAANRARALITGEGVDDDAWRRMVAKALGGGGGGGGGDPSAPPPPPPMTRAGSGGGATAATTTTVPATDGGWADFGAAPPPVAAAPSRGGSGSGGGDNDATWAAFDDVAASSATTTTSRRGGSDGGGAAAGFGFGDASTWATFDAFAAPPAPPSPSITPPPVRIPPPAPAPHVAVAADVATDVATGLASRVAALETELAASAERERALTTRLADAKLALRDEQKEVARLQGELSAVRNAMKLG